MAQDTHATAVREETSCASAAINEQFDARDETGVIRRQKNRSFGDFIGLPHSPNVSAC
jgi:hypothetical protein